MHPSLLLVDITNSLKKQHFYNEIMKAILLIIRKKFVPMYGDGCLLDLLWPSFHNTYIKSYCTPETNIILYQN